MDNTSMRLGHPVSTVDPMVLLRSNDISVAFSRAASWWVLSKKNGGHTSLDFVGVIQFQLAEIKIHCTISFLSTSNIPWFWNRRFANYWVAISVQTIPPFCSQQSRILAPGFWQCHPGVHFGLLHWNGWEPQPNETAGPLGDVFFLFFFKY